MIFSIKVVLERSWLYLMLVPLPWNISRLLCMWIMKRIFYVIAILLNFNMILHVIITREGNMVTEIVMLLNYLSSCWDCYRFFLLPRICSIFIVLIFFSYDMPIIGIMLDLNVFVLCYMMFSLCFHYYLSCEHQQNRKPTLMAIKKELVGRQPNEWNLLLLLIYVLKCLNN